MANEIHVLFRGALPKRAALSRAMKELDFPLSIPKATGSLEQQSGFMPMRLGREETGVEFDVFDGRNNVEQFADQPVDPSFDRVGSFRWGGSEMEMLCALCGAAALAKLTNGMVLEEQEGKLFTPAEAIDYARQGLDVAENIQKQPSGTRPADLKRYLRPLLEKRSDLVLVGRFLLIRPVRHFLRGAFFDRVSDRFQFRVWKYLQPLFGRPEIEGYLDYVKDGSWRVWQPQFKSFLMDALAEDVFRHVGRITTLEDVAGALVGTEQFLRGFDRERVMALVLAGQRDRAAERVREIEQRYPHFGKTSIEQLWGFVDRDINDVCAQFHADEASFVRGMKLEEIWEPSPFPVELPVAERAKVAEPVFVPEPWIALSPPALEEIPIRPGAVHFAKDWLYRNGMTKLLWPLTREQAESWHRDQNAYVLAARRADGLGVVIRYKGFRWPDHPNDWMRPPGGVRLDIRIDIELHGSDHRAHASFYERDGLLYLSDVDVYERRTRHVIWVRSIDKEGQLEIRDRRPEGEISTKRALNESESEYVNGAIPEFGQSDELATRVLSCLRSEGYGALS